MNAHNLSDVDSYAKLLDDQMRILDVAASRRGERPRDRMSRQELLYYHSLGLLNYKMQNAQLGNGTGAAMMRSKQVPPSYPLCDLPSAALQKIRFRELRLETHYWGRYLVCSLTPPWSATGIGTIIEDEWGEAMQLQLYHQLRPDAPQETQDMVVPADMVFIIKKPNYKVTADGGYGIRVNHVSNVLWLATVDEGIPNAWHAPTYLLAKGTEVWRQEGNVTFKAGRYREALVTFVALAPFPLRSCLS
jgi:hypothetical protein